MAGRKRIVELTEAVEFARRRTKRVAVRRDEVQESIDVQALRKKLKITQTEFAVRFGLTLATVQNWEQGHRTPEGPARVLLKIIDKRPDLVERVLAAG